MRRLPPGRPLEAPGSPAFLPGAARPGVMAWVRLSPRCSRAPRRVGPPIPRDGRLASFLCSRAPRGMAGPIPVVQAWAAGLLASSSQIDARRAGGRSRRLAGDSRGSPRDSRAAPRQAPSATGQVARASALLAWAAATDVEACRAARDGCRDARVEGGRVERGATPPRGTAETPSNPRHEAPVKASVWLRWRWSG